MNTPWTITTLIFFFMTLVIATPFFTWGIIENRKNYKLYGSYDDKKIIFPIKIIGGLLLLLEILKLVVNATTNNFVPDVLPFHYSDYVIFTLATFAFSKKDTLINKLSFINFMMIGGAIVLSLLVVPNMVVDFRALYCEKIAYNTVHAFITHYFIFYAFLWLVIWKIIKLSYKDILLALFSAIIVSIITMSFGFIFRANYDYCLASPFSGTPGDYHPDWSYIQPIYAFLIWLPLSIILLVGIFTLVWLINYKMIYRKPKAKNKH